MNPDDDLPPFTSDDYDRGESRESRKLVSKTPLPLRSIGVLFLLLASQSLAFDLVFPFVNQMILEIGVVDDPEKVGFYSGLIESVFAFMSLLAVPPCTYFSDRYGRKPVILFGITGLALSTSLFGMSHKFWLMVVSRCLGGALGSTISAMKIMTAELTDKSNQGDAFSGLIISYRLGQILGQPLGGFLSHPELRFPMFRSWFWYNYPYSLPCFITSAFAMFAVTLSYFFLQETLASKRKQVKKQPNYGAIEAPRTTSNGAQPKPVNGTPPPSLKSILTMDILALLINSIGMVLVSEATFALYPLFAFTPIESGGLGVSEATIGVHMSIRAVTHIVGMMFYSPLERKLGTLKLYRLTMLIGPICFVCMPILNLLARNGDTSSILFTAVLFLLFTSWAFASLAWTGITILINDATPSPAALASLNGASQMAIALPQSIAPVFANSLFAYSVSTQIFRGNLIWVVLIVISAATAVQAFTLKSAKHDWRKEYRSGLDEVGRD